MYLTHHNRVSLFGSCLTKNRSAAVPPLLRRGLMLRICLVHDPKDSNKEPSPLERGDRSVRQSRILGAIA